MRFGKKWKKMNYNRVFQRLFEFSNLPVGWHFGGGIPPSEDTIHQASKILCDLSRFPFKKVDVVPGVDGEVQIFATFDSISFEITLQTPSQGTLVVEGGNREICYLERKSPDEISELLREYAHALCIGSGIYIPNTLWLRTNSSQASHSRTAPMGGEFLLYKSLAPSQPAETCALTSVVSMADLPESRRYSGDSLKQSFQANRHSHSTHPMVMDVITT
jgi:hypothetical protein